VDPLVVAGGLGEQVHALLGDLDPVADGEFLADAGLQRGQGGDVGGAVGSVVAAATILWVRAAMAA